MKYFLMIALSAMLMAGCGNGKNAQEYAGQAVTAAENGRWQECLDNCNVVLQRSPDSVSVLVLKGIALKRLGKASEALAAVRKAVELDARSFAGRYMYGLLLADEPGQEQKALDELTKALRLQNSDINTLLLLGQVSGRINDDATDLYLDMLPTEYKYRPEISTELGIFYARRNNVAGAQKAFSEAYYQAPAAPQTVLNLARFLDYYSGDASNAIVKYQEYLALTANKAEFNGVRTVVEGRISALHR